MKSLIRTQALNRNKRIPCDCMRCKGKEMPKNMPYENTKGGKEVDQNA